MSKDEYKGFKIISSGYSLMNIKAKGKGSVAKELRGSYTSKTLAMKAIDNYLSSRGEGNAKNTANSKD